MLPPPPKKKKKKKKKKSKNFPNYGCHLKIYWKWKMFFILCLDRFFQDDYPMLYSNKVTALVLRTTSLMASQNREKYIFYLATDASLV